MIMNIKEIEKDLDLQKDLSGVDMKVKNIICEIKKGYIVRSF